MGQVWSIAKRRFGKNWERRLWLFDKLVWTGRDMGMEREKRNGKIRRKIFKVDFRIG